MDKIIARSSHRYRVLFIVLTTLLLLSVIIFSSYRASAESATPAANEHIVTLHDNGTDKGFITRKSTLREALAEQNIRVDAKDLIEPGLDDKLIAGSYQVNIYRARPIAIHDGKVDTKVITAYRTPSQIAKEANVSLHDEDMTRLAPSSDPLSDGAAEVMTITRAMQFTFNFYGKTETAYTQAKTVGDMLKEKHITMDPKDGVSPSVAMSIAAGMVVRIWRDGVQTITQDEDVKFDTKTIQDADQPVGYRKVQAPGENGKKTVTYEVNLTNGVETSRKEINSVVTHQPIEQVEVVGSRPIFSGDFAAALAQLRKCEAGGNYANTNNPTYRGAYQYDYKTWANYQGYYDPAAAPPAVQDQKAWETYQRRGWQPWPVCGAPLPDTYR